MRLHKSSPFDEILEFKIDFALTFGIFFYNHNINNNINSIRVSGLHYPHHSRRKPVVPRRLGMHHFLEKREENN
jgi:hypothetical protein